MATISDLIEDLEGSEVEGFFDSATRKFLATGAAATDAQILTEAFGAAGVPSAGAFFPGNTNLVCVGRRVRLVRNSNRNVEIICQYQRLGTTRSGFIFSGSTSLSQEVTQLDRNGNQVFVSHTWPAYDEDFPNQTHIQGSDTAVLAPQATLTATGQLQVAFPDMVGNLWVGSMNSTFWAGADPYSWLCTRVDFSPLQVGFGQFRWWEFTFEFQRRQGGWIPRVFFIDPRTGKPPPNLVPGVGYKPVDWYGSLNFNIIFPVT